MALLLREDEVEALLDMPSVVGWVEESFRLLGEGRAVALPRQRVRLGRGTLHVLPAGSAELGVLGLKSYTSFRGGTRFLVLLYSAESGELLALVEARALGVARTGAASGVATRHLARPDARVMAVFGAGAQARGQVEAVACCHELDQVRVFSPTAERRERFAAEMSSRLDVAVVPCASPAEALEGAGIVTTITTSSRPVFEPEQLGEGVHINAAGSNSLVRTEIDPRLVRDARVVVDSRVQAREEAGDLLLGAERGWLRWDTLIELGEIVAGRAPGRELPTQLTVFESQGLGIQDVAVAARVYERAVERGVGRRVDVLT